MDRVSRSSPTSCLLLWAWLARPASPKLPQAQPPQRWPFSRPLLYLASLPAWSPTSPQQLSLRGLSRLQPSELQQPSSWSRSQLRFSEPPRMQSSRLPPALLLQEPERSSRYRTRPACAGSARTCPQDPTTRRRSVPFPDPRQRWSSEDSCRPCRSGRLSLHRCPQE